MYLFMINAKNTIRNPFINNKEKNKQQALIWITAYGQTQYKPIQPACHYKHDLLCNAVQRLL